MTEAEWLAGGDPQAMLRWLGEPGSVSGSDPEGRAYVHRVTDRKLRLFACAAARRCREAKDLKAIAAVEEAADAAASANVYDSIAADAVTGGCEWLAHADAARAAGHWAARKVVGAAALLRDVFGNPWSPILRVGVDWGLFMHHDRHLLVYERWLTPTVLAVAHAAYDERPGRKCEKCDGTGKELVPVYEAETYGSTETRVVCYTPVMNSHCNKCRDAGRIPDGALDPTNLSVLADALEDAGCDCGGLLDHLRSPGPHVRGCWAVDCILGRE